MHSHAKHVPRRGQQGESCPRSALSDLKFKGSGTVAYGVRNVQAKESCPRGLQMGLMHGMPVLLLDPCVGRPCCLVHHYSFFHLPKLGPAPGVCPVPLSPWTSRAGVGVPASWLSPSSAHASSPQLFLKEHLHQLLESMREHVLHLAALTLQRCFRGFLVQRRFRSLRRKIILLQSRARGYLARCGSGKGGLPAALYSGLVEAVPEPRQ